MGLMTLKKTESLYTFYDGKGFEIEISYDNSHESKQSHKWIATLLTHNKEAGCYKEIANFGSSSRKSVLDIVSDHIEAI